MSDLSLNLLRDAGLEPDWMTVYLGWRGFHGWSTTAVLPSLEAQNFAYERIGLGSAVEDELIVHVMDADIQVDSLCPEERFLKQLAALSPVSPELARRKWRLAALRPLCERARTAPPRLPHPPDVDEDWFDYLRERLIYFASLWDCFVNHPPLPTRMDIVSQGRSDLLDEVSEYEAWIETERAAILAESAKGFSGGGG